MNRGNFARVSVSARKTIFLFLDKERGQVLSAIERGHAGRIWIKMWSRWHVLAMSVICTGPYPVNVAIRMTICCPSDHDVCEIAGVVARRSALRLTVQSGELRSPLPAPAGFMPLQITVTYTGEQCPPYEHPQLDLS